MEIFLAWLFYLLFPLLLMFILVSFVLAILEENFLNVKSENVGAETIPDLLAELLREWNT